MAGVSYPNEDVQDDLRNVIKSYLDQADIDGKLQLALAGGTTKAAVDSELMGDLEQSGFFDEILDGFNLNSPAKKRRNDFPSSVQVHSGDSGPGLSSLINSFAPELLNFDKLGKFGLHFYKLILFANVSAHQSLRWSGDVMAERLPHPNINYMRRQLFLQIHKGKAFTGHLLDQPSLPGHISPTYTLHVSFRGQRFRSRPAVCTEEPNITESFLLELHGNDNRDSLLSTTDLLSIADKIHFVLVKTNPNSDNHLISSHYLDWRSVLCSERKHSLSLELMGIGSENSIPVGLLDMTLSVIPQPDLLAEEVLVEQTRLEKNRQADRDRLFLIYTTQWWREYLQIRPSHDSRIVKLYAPDENQVNRPVCSYVQPLRCGRLLDDSRQASRFVSLIQFGRPVAVGNSSRVEQWSSYHSFLATNKGDVENHATLLCSILLGFGLDAYVCLGTKGKENRSSPHAWVVTIDKKDDDRGEKKLDVIFRESISANRYIHKVVTATNQLTNTPPAPQHPYRTVGCVFNHKSFYANIQTSDNVIFTDFDLSNTSLWKRMDSDAILSVSSPSISWMDMPPLQKSLYDSSDMSNRLEIEFRRMIHEYRDGEGLTTTFDDQLSYVLTTALSGYEIERITGHAYGNEEFQQSVRSLVPTGHTFMAYPMQFYYVNARRSFAALVKSKHCSQVLKSRGDNVKLAVRVRVYPYPESAVATWIAIASIYQSIL